MWIDGSFREPGSPAYAATDRGATLGDAVFDTCLCLGGKVVWKDAHLARLSASADAFAHVVDPDLLAAAYSISSRLSTPAVLRVTVSRGPGGRGLTLVRDGRSQITATLSRLPDGIMFAPQRLGIARIRRNETAVTSRHKTAAYLDAIVALDHARRDGADDAIFLNTQGELTCTTVANLFVLRGDTLTTPPATSGLIEGITRGRILAVATDLGLRVNVAPLRPSDLDAADQVFATNSLRLMIPAPNCGTDQLATLSGLVERLSKDIEQETGTQIPPPAWTGITGYNFE
ncbi:MAG: aminotransferase class IV [Pseudomonadota bacterium]